MNWIDVFDHSYRPTILDMRSYFMPQVLHLLERLNDQLFREYRVKATPARYTKRNGWVIPYTLRGVPFFSLVIQDESSFSINQIKISNENELQTVFTGIDRRYHGGFSQKAQAMIKSRKERARSNVRDRDVEDNRNETPPGSDPERLNKFHWIPALSPAKLRKLYQSSANHMLDHDLLEDIGILFFLRCTQGVEEFALLRSEKLKCHHCGVILSKKDGLILCACGYQYTFAGYVNSFNEHRMPGGSAVHIFAEYIDKWPKARSDSEKMNVVDMLIHQCHISMSSGLRLRSVLKNLIDASQKTAEKLILELAYSNTDRK